MAVVNNVLVHINSTFLFILQFITGEFLLRWLPNGGGVVLARAVWCSLWIYLTAVAVHAYTKPGATLSFDAIQMRLAVHETLPWFGAILAACYAALYTRFASQWTYLAGLYNQIMETTSTVQCREDNLAIWKAAFVEDAVCLHLATKRIFRGAVRGMVRERAVSEVLRQNASLGVEALEDLKRKLSPGS